MKRWFERSFAFDLPTWMYPNVVERLRGTPARIEEMVAGLDANLLEKRVDSKWSIKEQVGHLYDLEPLWLGRVEDILQGAERLRDADLENHKTHEANHNADSISHLTHSFRQARKELIDRLDEMDEANIERTALHPRLEEPMRLLDLLFFVAEHDDHHLAHITSIKK